MYQVFSNNRLVLETTDLAEAQATASQYRKAGTTQVVQAPAPVKEVIIEEPVEPKAEKKAYGDITVAALRAITGKGGTKKELYQFYLDMD